MKIRSSFVSNSSSCSFLITNKTNAQKTLVDFVKENPNLLNDFILEYEVDSTGMTQEKMIENAEACNITFKPRKTEICEFGDRVGDLLGRVYDYILRSGGESESFRWKFKEYLR